MINVTFSPECIQLMREFGIREKDATTTINDSNQGLVTDGLDRIIATRWFADDCVLLVDSRVEKTELDNSKKIVTFLEVEAQVVLVLASVLPTGRLDRGTSAEEFLAVVAASFGSPVTCHPDRPPSFLYSGRWDGREIQVLLHQCRGATLVIGSLYPAAGTCELVWTLDLEKYRDWLARHAIGGLIRRPPSPPYSRSLDAPIAAAKAYVENFSKLYPGVRVLPESIRYGLAMIVLRQTLGDGLVSP